MNVHVSPAAAAQPAFLPTEAAAITPREVGASLAVLGAQLREAFEAEIEAEKSAPDDADLDQHQPFMVTYNRCKELVTAIEAIEPVTFLDFGVKMLALAWSQGDDALAVPCRRHESTDARILEAFVPSILTATGLMPFARRA